MHSTGAATSFVPHVAARLAGVLLALASAGATATTPSTIETGYRGQCHGEDFGAGATGATPADASDRSDESSLVVVSEADMTSTDGTDVVRVGDFNVTTRLIQYSTRRPAAAGEPGTSSAPATPDVTGRFVATPQQAEALVCAANAFWAAPTDGAVVPGAQRMSELLAWRPGQQKKVDGMGTLGGAAAQYADVFWRIVGTQPGPADGAK